LSDFHPGTDSPPAGLYRPVKRKRRRQQHLASDHYNTVQELEVLDGSTRQGWLTEEAIVVVHVELGTSNPP